MSRCGWAEGVCCAPMPGATHSAFATLIERAPCDCCRHRERCGTGGLACACFRMFLAGEGDPRWRNAPRLPRVIQGQGRSAAERSCQFQWLPRFEVTFGSSSRS